MIGKIRFIVVALLVCASAVWGQQGQTPELAPLHDIVSPWAITSWSVPLILLLASLLGVVGLVLAWFFGTRRHQASLMPHEVALRDLAFLRKSETTPYEASIRVSDILRRFIHDQHGMDAIRKTSIEFLNSLQSSVVFNNEERVALADFLEVADLIKFARAYATTRETEQLFDTAEKLVAVKKEEKEEEGKA